MANFTVVYDACLLYSASLRDLAVELGRSGLIRAKWTARTYAAWITGTKPEDIERIKAAMAGRPLADSDDEDRTITSEDSNAPRLVATAQAFSRHPLRR